MQAQRLDHAARTQSGKVKTGIGIGGKELTRVDERLDVAAQRLGLVGDHPLRAVTRHQTVNQIPAGAFLVPSDRVVGCVVNHVHRPTAHIEHDVVSVEFILMYHVGSVLLKKHRSSTVAERCFPFDGLFALGALFALLVGHPAGGLAGRLAGGLAFTAAAVFYALFEVAGAQRLDPLHVDSTPSSV